MEDGGVGSCRSSGVSDLSRLVPTCPDDFGNAACGFPGFATQTITFASTQLLLQGHLVMGYSYQISAAYSEH